MDNSLCESQELTIDRLQQENSKLKEECNLLNNEIKKYKNMISSLKCFIDNIVENINTKMY